MEFKTSEVAFHIYGGGQALETPVMHWTHLIEVRCRDLILCLAPHVALAVLSHAEERVLWRRRVARARNAHADLL